MRPNFREELKLWRQGYKRIIGLDEAGRGPLAGPVVAAAVIVKTTPSEVLNSKQFLKLNIKDSKQLSSRQREELYGLIVKHPLIEWGIGKVSEKIIDRINILEATKLAMQKAVKNLVSKNENAPEKQIHYLLLDGNFKINSQFPQKSVVRADEKVFSCAAASIVAKVTRDRLMQRYHKKYPTYGFDRHKGYPTKFHYEILRKFGPCEIHRKTFRLS